MPETQAEKLERIKKEKDGLEVLNDLYVYAVLGEEVPQEDVIRLKWYGLNKQEDNTYTLKVNLDAGELNIEQLDMISKIANEFCKGELDFTHTQDLEFKNITLTTVPAIFKLLDSVKLYTVYTDGDVPRGVITCPVNGLDHDEVADVRDLVTKVNESFRGNKNFSNLPNKFTISINGCTDKCTRHEFQDIGFSTITTGNGKILFEVVILEGEELRVIGYVTKSQVLPLTKAVAKIYRDFGIRDNRDESRLGSLVKLWGASRFVDILHSEINFKIKDTNDIGAETSKSKQHFGIHESKQKAKSYIGCAIKQDDLNADMIEKLTDTLKKYEVSAIKLTTAKNIVVLDAPTLQAEELSNELKSIGISSENN